MILSDGDILREMDRGNIEIEPIDAEYEGAAKMQDHKLRELVLKSDVIQPSSVDFHLGNEFVQFGSSADVPYIDPQDSEIEYGDDPIVCDEYIVSPGEFVLGKTLERISLPAHIRATVEGRSSWGRLAITPHVEAGYVDAGYEGNVTLEILNLGEMPVKIRAGDKFCQFEFAYLNNPSLSPYDGKYQGDKSVSTSQINEDYIEQ